MRLRALTHICYVRASQLVAQIDSLQSKGRNYKGKNNLPTKKSREITLILCLRAFEYEH